MQVLEKILQEIKERIKKLNEDAGKYEDSGAVDLARKNDWEIYGLRTASNIIRSHMEDDRWIPVEMEDDEWASKTELPEENQPVWITIEWASGERGVRKAVFKDKSFWCANHITRDLITKAWMPRFVPAPYQPKEEKP